MKRRYFSQSGQALLEALLLLPLFGALLLLFSFFYFKFTQKVAIESLVDQALLCSTSHKLKSCENRLREKIQNLSLHIYINKLNVAEFSTTSSTKYQIILQYSFWDSRQISIERSLTWTD